MATTILLQNGTVITHQGDRVVILREHDVLIRGSKIAQIGSNLTAHNDARVVDCSGKIISPGFIDTHHHLWQTQLKGRHGNEGFMDYVVSGNLQSFNYEPADIFWGQLAGALEAIDGGVTTVVDHSHMTYSPEHAFEAVRATASSGLRAIYCYSSIWRMKNWSATIDADKELLPAWWYSTLESLAKHAPFGNGRVSLGVGFDQFQQPKEVVVDLWERCRSLGVKLMTTHYVADSMLNSVKILSDYNLLDDRIIFSHTNGISESDAQTLIQHGAYISTTPDTELQMGLGEIVAFRPDMKSNTSIGIDCHSNNSSDVLSQLRLGLQHARGNDNLKAKAAGGYPSVQIKLEEAFNLGTIQGARAVNMEGEIGSIEVGKRADLVVFDATSPGMVCAAEEDALAAVLLHASVRDVEIVIVDGVVRKQGGKLVDIGVCDRWDGSVMQEVIGWSEVRQRLLQSREEIRKRGKGQDREAAMNFFFTAS